MLTIAPEKTSIHRDLLEQMAPDWLINAAPERQAAIRASATRLPDWYSRASVPQQQALKSSFNASFTAQTQLDNAMSALQDIDTFAAPLLTSALKDRFGVDVDVNTTLLCLRRPLEISDLEIEISHFEVMKLTLLQAALHNFEASECEEGAFHRASGFVVETATPGSFESINVNMTVRGFLSLCRTLDIGAQYQTCVQAFFQSPTAQEASLRQSFITSQKTALKAAADLALLKKDIQPDDYTMIVSVVNGEVHPSVGNRPVWFRDLSLMKRRMTGCVVFSICEQYRYTDDFIVYVPHDPEHPLKRYTKAQWRDEFKRQFTARDPSASDAGAPTVHQRFFSQFVAYADRLYYFSQFTRRAADAPSDPLHSIWVKVAQFIPPFSTIARIKELPPERQPPREPVEDPYLNAFGVNRKGVDGLWSANTDLFVYLYEQNRDKVIADARSHAVPTADVDAKVRAEKLNHLLEIGMLGLNMVSMFVPVLGEIMLTVMAGQLLYESFEGAIEWSEGDREAARTHLIDVAENLALIGVMAGAGKGLSKLTAVKPESVVERLEPVTLPNGESRLWKPDLSAYECEDVLSHSAPDALGHHRLNGKTYIRQAGKVYETRFDESLNKWRIQHPRNAQAYQPILEHNGHGAWRHTLERPLEWDRLTLLRRMGPVTEAFIDEQLLQIADVSGISDNALRKMHRDHLPPPPELADALRLFEADAQSAPVLKADRGSMVGMLQRACPGLDPSAAQRVLLDANAEELTRLQTTRRVPLKMLEEARWYARQGRVNQAFASLHQQVMASADGRWLALHALERLPGWSDEVRLEIREGSISGPLLDGIGSETAASRKYLVKNGPTYQAFDETGEALNSIPSQGDNFFASIMHALPDQSRQALGVPHVAQSSALREAVIEWAGKHRTELAQRLVQRTGRRKAFKPPVRVAERTLGYYASGRGQGMNPSLVTRVRDVYPQLTDQQANAFILKQLREGKTDAQIFNLLQTRLREWQQLETTLDQWAGEPGSESVLRSMLGGKGAAARNIRQAWRNAPLAEEQPLLRTLEVVCDDPLPPLTADFSHVEGLLLWGRGVTDANVDALLGAFPKLKRLRINSTSDELTNVPNALSTMPDLTSLSLSSAVPYAADMPFRLSALTTLEELSVYSSGYAPLSLDVSRMRNLRELKVLAPSLFQWPTGVLELPNLVRLDLRSTGISSLPDGVFQGREQFWSGLSLDWSHFTRENFKPAYEYVKNHPEHLIDREEMVRDYCKSELNRLADGLFEPSVGLFNNFVEQWQGADARFEAVDALSAQFRELEGRLNAWSGHTMPQNLDLQEVMGRSWAAAFIKTNWRHGVFRRYGSTADASALALPKVQLSEFPALPAGAFDHVQELYLKGVQAPAEQFRGFIQGFTELQTLDLSANGLTHVPIAPGDLAQLTRLDLSGNRIAINPEVQQAVDGLHAVEYLDLSANPLTSLDVRDMTQLKALNLRDTDLQQWPTGMQELPQLAWVDLRGSKISSLPEDLADDLLLKTQLTGLSLTAQATTALKAARQRVEIAHGLPVGTLEKFDLQEVPATFPPTESGFAIARHLLSVQAVPAGEGSAHFAQRLQRYNPALADDQALRAIEQMRERGATDVQLSERFAQWDQTFDDLTQRLNGWLFTRETRGAGWIVSAQSRRQGALRILECWSEGLTGASGTMGETLNLNGLQLGDLPELPAVFSHVDTLDLTGVRLTKRGSDGFLKAFTQVKSLKLNGNGLQAVPEPIQSMTSLERLELSANRFSDTGHLYAALNRLEHLKWLDLGHNALDDFDVAVFVRLESLDLRHNNLIEWPQGVLDANHLGTLNLSSNDIVEIPAEALDGAHDALMSGTDLSENFNVALGSLERLRDYREAGGRETVLGLSRSELDEMIAEANGEADGESESFESDESLPDEQPDFQQSVAWLANATSEELAGKTRVWNQLAAEPDNAAFFHLLSRLQDTQEFRVANADLTRRVWTVMDAAASNSELREVLFASANTHGTCVDGRILTFSGLESKVFTHNALLDIPAGRLAAKGEALLKLSRQLFRLDRVDELATKAAAHSGRDEAEVRLGYRIGLTDGWSDGLELPGQPKHMTYNAGVTPRQLAEARNEVTSAEQSDKFYEDLIQRDYWVQYLKEKYPEEFRALDEAELPEEGDGADEAALMIRLFDLAAARNSKMIELSRKEAEGA
jgi:Leucine-rich repeat (LRR) protein